MSSLVFLCGARDFHAMDWYKSAKELLHEQDVVIVTDLIAGEGFNKLVDDTDKLHQLFVLDRYLLRSQSKLGNVWRNILKFLVLPLQVFLLKRFAKENPKAVYHAHSMYYLWLAWLAGVRFVGTPQGSDILIKPFRSKVFRYLSSKAMRSAVAVTVDSVAMQETIKILCGVDAYVIQNGINLDAIKNVESISKFKDIPLLSIRGFTSLYRIEEIVSSRNSLAASTGNSVPMVFIYPFYDEQYKEHVKSLCSTSDSYLGRLPREQMYEFLLRTSLVLSIPSSDSSPRSVYESVFCGASVAVTKNSYLDSLPKSMRDRLIVVDLSDPDWLEDAINESIKIVSAPFIPCQDALKMFDQKQSFLKVLELFDL